MDQGFPGLLPHVGPWQLHGIEINPYAFELAQMSIWIGYLQWIRNNGFGEPDDPVLRPMDTFECKDAILDLSDPDHPKEPEWPKVDFIVGNPPFLGGRSCGQDWGMNTWISFSGSGTIGFRQRPIFAVIGLRRRGTRSPRIFASGPGFSPPKRSEAGRIARYWIASRRMANFLCGERPRLGLGRSHGHVSMVGFETARSETMS